MGPTHSWSLGPLQIRINWLILACVAFTIFGFVQLGFWQLSRAGEKLAAQEEFEQQQLLSAQPIDRIDPSTAVPAALANLHVSLQGRYLNDRTILVTAQFFDGQIGYEVITPLRLNGSDRLVLVSRGWTSGILPPDTPPRIRPVEGQVDLTAQIHVPDPDERVFGSQIDATSWPLRIRSFEMDVIESIIDEPLFPYLVRLTEDQPGMLVRHWPETNADIDTHLSYALQWFTFAVMVAVAALLASSNLLSLIRDPEGKKFN
jgi:surfeit locus 1 family protein